MLRTRNRIFPIFPKAAASLGDEKTKTLDVLFRRSWLFALFLMTLNLGGLGFGNVNNIEKAAFLISGMFFVLKNSWEKKALIGICLVVTSVIFFGFFAEPQGHSWSRSISALIALFSMLIFTTVTPKFDDRIFILRTISILALGIVTYGAILFALYGNPLFKQDHTGAMRLGGSTLPAFLAAAAYTSSLASILLYSFSRNKKYLILVAFNLMVGMLSGTRMAFLCSVLTVFFSLILPFRGIFTKFAIATVFSTVGAITIFTIGDQILIRFMSASLSGRNLIHAVLTESLSKNPYSGIGFGHHGALIPDSVSRFTGTVAAHNEYLRLAVELGYLGAFMFLLGLVVVLLKEFNKCNMVGKLILLTNTSVLLVYASTDNVFFLTYSLLAVVIIANCTPIFAPIPQTNERI